MLLLIFSIFIIVNTEKSTVYVPDECEYYKKSIFCTSIYGKTDMYQFDMPNKFSQIKGSTSITNFKDLSHDLPRMDCETYITFVSFKKMMTMVVETDIYKITIRRVSFYNDNRNLQNTLNVICIPNLITSKLIHEFDDYRMVVTYL